VTVRGLLSALALLLVGGGCAGPSSEEQFTHRLAELQGTQRQRECGVRGAMGFGGKVRAQAGDAVRACELPTAEEVERACEVHEAVANPDRRDPEFPGELLYDFPEYAVGALRCTFDDPVNSRATCTFELATATTPAQPVQAVLSHEFYTLNTPLTFEYGTSWRTSGSCLPQTGTGMAR